MHKRPGDGDTLLLPTRKLVGIACFVGQSNECESLFRFCNRPVPIVPKIINGTAAFSAAVNDGNKLYC